MDLTLDVTHEPVDMLKRAVSLLTGKSCWSAIGSGAAGSNVLLEFGRRIPLKRPAANRQLSPLQRSYEGELSLFIECAWRLEGHDQILTSSGDDDRPNGPIAMALRDITGQSVISAVVAAAIPDLYISLTGDFVIRLFCDQGNLDQAWNNYSLRIGDTFVVVGPRGRVMVERRESQA